MFPYVTHEDYLDNVTVGERNWMLQIHHLVKKAEAEEEKRAANG